MLGLIGTKIGMTEQFEDNGNVVPVTLIKVEKNIIINKKTEARDGYNALVLGIVDLKEKKVKKPFKGQFKNNITPKRYLKEFRVDNPEKYEIGQEIGLDLLNGINLYRCNRYIQGKRISGSHKETWIPWWSWRARLQISQGGWVYRAEYMAWKSS